MKGRRRVIQGLLFVSGIATIPFSNIFSTLIKEANAFSLTGPVEADEPPDDFKFRYFSIQEVKVMGAFADRVLPGQTSPAMPSASEIKVVERLDWLIPAKLTAEAQKDFKSLLWFFDVLSLGWFTNYSDDEKDNYIRSWQQSSFAFSREGFRVLKKLTAAAYFSCSEVWPAIGYLGPYHDVPWSQKEPSDRAISPDFTT